MTNELLATLANLGAGALLASAALPVFARITALRFVHDPASSHRALVWALSLASALMLAPWLRGRFPRGAAAVPAGLLVRGAPLSAATSNASALGFYALSAVGAAWSPRRSRLCSPASRPFSSGCSSAARGLDRR